jgi:cyclophilin family peptidyl-prolyl cis-trans isomerase
MKTKLKLLIINYFITILFGLDSLAIQKYAPKLGLNMKGFINSPKSQTKLIDSKIDEIKKRALNFKLEDNAQNDIVYMETSVGKLTLKLFPRIAPEHCKNFKKLANSGYYDGTTFHRVIPGFMIQGGDILSRDFDTDNDGTGGPGWIIPAEFNNISHKRGILSMARGSDPNSAGSQFFICTSDATHLDGKYTVFGEVISKIHVIDRIVTSPSGYSIAKISSKPKIPEDENSENWIKLKDPRTNTEIYSKVPNGIAKDTYKNQQQQYLYSDRPLNDVIIKSVRVMPDESK